MKSNDYPFFLSSPLFVFFPLSFYSIPRHILYPLDERNIMEEVLDLCSAGGIADIWEKTHEFEDSTKTVLLQALLALRAANWFVDMFSAYISLCQYPESCRKVILLNHYSVDYTSHIHCALTVAQENLNYMDC